MIPQQVAISSLVKQTGKLACLHHRCVQHPERVHFCWSTAAVLKRLLESSAVLSAPSHQRFQNLCTVPRSMLSSQVRISTMTYDDHVVDGGRKTEDATDVKEGAGNVSTIVMTVQENSSSHPSSGPDGENPSREITTPKEHAESSENCGLATSSVEAAARAKRVV